MLSLDRQNALREQYRATNPGWRPATEVFAAEVGRRLRPETRLLDLGCGRGGLIEQLSLPYLDAPSPDVGAAAPHGPQAPLISGPARTAGSGSSGWAVGVDPDFASVHEHRLPALPRTAAASDALPFPAATFDLIYAAWLLEHLADPGRTFAEIGRVLRGGGAFVFITPNAGHPLAWANRFAGRLGSLQGRLVSRLYGRAPDDTFATRYQANSERAIAGLATDSGLRLASLTTISDPTYLALGPGLLRLSEGFERLLPAGRAIHLVGVIVK